MTTTTTHDLLAPTLAGLEQLPQRWRSKLARRLVHDRLTRLGHGALRIEDRFDGGERRFGDPSAAAPTVRVLDPEFYGAIVARGSLGAAEAWVDGLWTSDDLTAVVRVLARNPEALRAVDGGFAKLGRPLLRLLHARNANTRRGSRRNIAAHYDLGNDFFALFLDPTMLYSSAIFERDDMTLEEAQIAKVDRLCRKLDLQPGDHLLEIGSGWGGLAIHAARVYGCRVTTTTISSEQFEHARRRIAAAGLTDRVTLLKQDYRDLAGEYDKLVSCEMIEAVGQRYLPDFLATCARLLKPGGVLALQAILIEDRAYAHAVRQVDFIKRHVFPGSFIPSVTAILDAATRHTDLRLTHLETFGVHYARTLRAWRENLYRRLDEVRRLGLDERFLRLWEYYLCYCEGGFAERRLDVGHLVMARPDARPELLLAPRDAARAAARSAVLTGDPVG